VACSRPIRYDTIDDLHWKTDRPAARLIVHTNNKNVLNGTKKVTNRSQETDGYGRDKRPTAEKN